MRPVVVAWTQGETAVIQNGGCTAGETVVTDGQMTLKPGSLVRIMNAGATAKRRAT